MIYSTIAMAHDALMNEFNVTQIQHTAVSKKLKENEEILRAYRNSPSSDLLRAEDIRKFEEKCAKLRTIEYQLSNKESRLADAIFDFNEHKW